MAAPKMIVKPLAFGMWTFSLPDTADLWLHWDGPGTGLYLASAKLMHPVQHPSARGTYMTRQQAQRAAEAFVAAATSLTGSTTDRA